MQAATSTAQELATNHRAKRPMTTIKLEEVNMGYVRNSTGPVESCDDGIGKCTAYDDVLVGWFHSISRRAEDGPRVPQWNELNGFINSDEAVAFGAAAQAATFQVPVLASNHLAKHRLKKV